MDAVPRGLSYPLGKSSSCWRSVTRLSRRRSSSLPILLIVEVSVSIKCSVVGLTSAAEHARGKKIGEMKETLQVHLQQMVAQVCPW